ncbi:MAG: response regulator [Marinospirillum sp.]|nr:response regulator [Marinospirillum sp.]
MLRPSIAESGLICVVDDDVDQAALLRMNLLRAGFTVTVFEDLNAFRKQVESGQLRPVAVIMDMMFPEGSLAGAQLIQELQLDETFQVPVIFTTARNDIQARLTALRAGAHAYLTKPLDINHLVFRLYELLESHDPWRILLVDDEKILMNIHARLLQGAGMQIQMLDDPMRLLEVYKSFQPDVVLMDLHMPGVSGLELTRLLREYQGLEQRPILFVSGEDDPTSRLAALETGADDFLIKPVNGQQLVSTIAARARRSRLDQQIQQRMISSLADLLRHRQALDHHAIVSVTDSHGKITYANEQFCRVSGYKQSELIGQSHRLLKSGHHSPEFYQNLWTTISAGLIWQGEVCNRRQDGSFYWVRSTITPFFDDAGNIRQHISIRTDISALKETQTALMQARDEAERANKAKSRFLSSMSHELRTPLNAILGFTQMLDGDQNLTDDQQDSLNEINKAGQHLLELINELLDLAKIESGHINLTLEDLWLAELEEECCPLMQPLAAQKSIKLQVNFPEGAQARADRMRLKQALLNLVSNAIKYNREQGEVEVFVTPAEEPGWLRFSVRDTGQGIPAEKLVDLAKPFARLGAEDTDIEGTGIGLTITRQLVRMMGGRTGVESQVGVGSIFWIELPGRIAGETNP